MSSNPYRAPVGSIHTRTSATREGGGKAVASLVLGLVSIITWLIPIIGLPTTITGLVLGMKGMKSDRKGIAIAGVVLSSIFLVMAGLNMALGAYLGATGQHPLINAPR